MKFKDFYLMTEMLKPKNSFKHIEYGSANRFLNETSDEVEYIYVGSSDGFEDENDDYDIYDLLKQSEILSKESSINILSDKDVNTVAVIKGNVVGGLWTSVDNEEYSFDVIVDEKYKRQGIGSELVDMAISEFNSIHSEMNFEMIADVVNPDMVKLLLKKGFEIIEDHHGHTIMKLKQNI